MKVIPVSAIAIPADGNPEITGKINDMLPVLLISLFT